MHVSDIALFLAHAIKLIGLWLDPVIRDVLGIHSEVLVYLMGSEVHVCLITVGYVEIVELDIAYVTEN